MTRALPIVLAIAFAAPMADGGQQDDEKISKRLVELLFPGMVRSIVEGLPDDFPREVLPDGATPLVSMSSFGGLSAVVEVETFTATDRTRFERKLAAAGWKLGNGPIGGGGLMASPVPVPKMYCQGDQLLQFSTQNQRDGRAVVRLDVRKMGTYGPCASDGARPPRSLFDDIEVPPMPPPPGSRPVGSSGGGGADAMEQTTRLETRLPVSEVEEYYTSILKGDGWTMDSRTRGEGVSMARFTLPSVKSGGVDAGRVGTLEALSVPGGDVFVTLRVIGPRREWGR